MVLEVFKSGKWNQWSLYYWRLTFLALISYWENSFSVPHGLENYKIGPCYNKYQTDPLFYLSKSKSNTTTNQAQTSTLGPSSPTAQPLPRFWYYPGQTPGSNTQHLSTVHLPSPPKTCSIVSPTSSHFSTKPSPTLLPVPYTSPPPLILPLFHQTHPNQSNLFFPPRPNWRMGLIWSHPMAKWRLGFNNGTHRYLKSL